MTHILDLQVLEAPAGENTAEEPLGSAMSIKLCEGNSAVSVMLCPGVVASFDDRLH
ncbi:SapB/AmfS family lanthipeptide [Streptomyces sp. NPDC000594]|uniref:SapB/AmfS family lanthipeptide n=1 Tax=Streptomyces sp. NPDC000594 TaxID=3154261 RepID=UPI003317570D